MNTVNFAAIILAAGFSSRMGHFKPLLKLGSSTVLDHTLSSFRTKLISDIIVVVGHNSEAMVRHMADAKVAIVENPDYQNGMFSSIQTGVAQLQPAIDAFFIMPVDIPLVRSDTIENLADAYIKNPGHIIRPRYQGRFGHPPLLPYQLIPTILDSTGEGGLREVLRECQETTIHLPVNDPNILMDLDEPEDYEAVLKR